jgi:toxin ParE1/3/4
MGCKIIFSPQAIADLESAVSFIATANPDADARFGNVLIDRVAILENFPLLGSPYSKHPGVRKLVSRPYIIFYRPRLEVNCLDILRYWHGARGEPEL